MQGKSILKIWIFAFKTGNVITKYIETGILNFKYNTKGFLEYKWDSQITLQLYINS
jgi:hypothetical protein